MRHYGYFDKSGKLQCESFRTALAALKLRNVSVVLTADEFKDKRSSQANRYYWGCVIDLIARALKDSGFEPRECTHDAVHEMLKYRFLHVNRPIGDGDECLTVIRSTTSLTTAEFAAYLEHCVRFAAEYLNVAIPPPGEQMEIAA